MKATRKIKPSGVPVFLGKGCDHLLWQMAKMVENQSRERKLAQW